MRKRASSAVFPALWALLSIQQDQTSALAACAQGGSSQHALIDAWILALGAPWGASGRVPMPLPTRRRYNAESTCKIGVCVALGIAFYRQGGAVWL